MQQRRNVALCVHQHYRKSEFQAGAGDRILLRKYSGSETKVDGAEYLIMREDDVLAVLITSAKDASTNQ